MIGVGIVGCNYGRTVLIPAFRQDPRCEVVALAGTDTARTAELARAANVARGLGSWQAMVEEPAVAVIAVAVPPDLQPAIAQRALDLGKPVFLEKPLAADLARGPPSSISIFRSCRHGGAPRLSWTMARSGACGMSS
jgi:predicted dehydrogenase